MQKYVRNSRSFLVLPRQTQSFRLEVFLSIPYVGEAIEEGRRHRANRGWQRDVWDSEAWAIRPLADKKPLAFAYYADWFNPFANKIAGKKVCSFSHHPSSLVLRVVQVSSGAI